MLNMSMRSMSVPPLNFFRDNIKYHSILDSIKVVKGQIENLSFQTLSVNIPRYIHFKVAWNINLLNLCMESTRTLLFRLSQYPLNTFFGGEICVLRESS